jgi:hypothetical protein
MEKKRSKGVTIFAWLMIILNIFMLWFSLDFRAYFEGFKSWHKNFIIIIILYSILSAAIGIIVGIGLLKLKDIMRRIGIVINSLDLLFGIPLFSLSLNDLRQYSYSAVVYELAKKPANLSIDTLANIAFYVMVSMIVMTFGLSILFIYFFTRPKVKEQFK